MLNAINKDPINSNHDDIDEIILSVFIGICITFLNNKKKELSL